MVEKRLSRGIHIIKKGSKYQVVQQPSAGKYKVYKTFTTRKAAQNFVRMVKSLTR